MGFLPIFLFSMGFLFLTALISYHTLRNTKQNYEQQKELLKNSLLEAIDSIKDGGSKEQLKMTLVQLNDTNSYKSAIQELVSLKTEQEQAKDLVKNLKKLLHTQRSYNDLIAKMPSKIVANVVGYKAIP